MYKPVETKPFKWIDKKSIDVYRHDRSLGISIRKGISIRWKHNDDGKTVSMWIGDRTENPRREISSRPVVVPESDAKDLFDMMVCRIIRGTRSRSNKIYDPAKYFRIGYKTPLLRENQIGDIVTIANGFPDIKFRYTKEVYLPYNRHELIGELNIDGFYKLELWWGEIGEPMIGKIYFGSDDKWATFEFVPNKHNTRASLSRLFKQDIPWLYISDAISDVDMRRLREDVSDSLRRTSLLQSSRS